MPSIREIIDAIERTVPLLKQEEWDNSGLLVSGNIDRHCSGVMLCLDVTPTVVDEAVERGCNLIVGHHPLIFKSIKSISDADGNGSAIIRSIKHDIAVYCAHTSLDNASGPFNVSAEMARMMGMRVTSSVTDTDTGVLAEPDTPVTSQQLLSKCLNVFTSDGLRHSRLRNGPIGKVVFGSGACGFLIPHAIAMGAQAIVTSDVRYHDFIDYGNKIFIVDLTHFDTEKCTKEIFRRIISQNFRNFAQVYCANETNPIEYLKVTPYTTDGNDKK